MAEPRREPDATAEEIGRRIAELRHECGMTQQVLGDACGLSRSSIANIESGRQELSVRHLLDISQALGSSVAEVAPAKPMPWLELAKLNQHSRLSHEELADECWRDHDYLNAIRYRGVAEGIALAQSHQIAVVAVDEKREWPRPSKPIAAPSIPSESRSNHDR